MKIHHCRKTLIPGGARSSSFGGDFAGFSSAKHSSNLLNQRRAAISIQELNLAQKKYSEEHPRIGYACNLSDLTEQGTVDGALAFGIKAGHHFEIRCPQQGAQKADSFTITALPVDPGVTGQFALCADRSGEVWYSKAGLVSDCLAMRKLIGQVQVTNAPVLHGR